MSIKIYNNNKVSMLSGISNLDLATESTSGLMSPTDKDIMNDFFKSQFAFTSLFTKASWTGSGNNVDSGTLSSAYTNFDFLVIIFRGVDASYEIQSVIVPTSMIWQGWILYGPSFTLSGYTRQLGIVFTSATAWYTYFRNGGAAEYGISNIIGVKRRS